MTTTSPCWMLPASSGLHRRLLAVEDARRAVVVAALVAAELHDAALGREVAAQDRQAAGRLDRVVERAHDLLAGRSRSPRARARRPSGRSTVIASSWRQAALLQALDDERDAAGLVEVGRDVAPAGLEVAGQRRALGDAVEVVDLEVDAGLARDREQVEHGVGASRRSSRRRRSRSPASACVMTSLGRRPRLRTSTTSWPASTATSAFRPSSAGTMLEPIGLMPEDLEGHRHRVRGELAAAGAGAGAGGALELGELLVAHRARRRACRRPRRPPGS